MFEAENGTEILCQMFFYYYYSEKLKNEFAVKNIPLQLLSYFGILCATGRFFKEKM
jgi:hypothetical protein